MKKESVVDVSMQKVQLNSATTQQMITDFTDESLRNAGSICKGNPHLQRAYQTLYKIMKYAAENGASDIFIAPEFPPAVKINGTLIPISDKAFSQENARDIVYSTMSERMIHQFEKDLELNYSHRANDAVRFRVNAYHEQGRVGLVMRTISTEIATLDELELPQVLKTLAMKRRGLIIVVGATGSGKSTSLAAMVDYRNSRQSGHIITIEDPIEFVHRHKKSIVTQREIGIDTANWHEALKSAMREAPDVVIVGEVRDQTAMSHAMELSQTGHLCMCTLHATNSNQAIERAINFYDEMRHAQIFMDLSMDLAAIVSQRLIRRKDGSGRVCAMEVMLNTPAVADLIMKGDIAGIKDIMERSDDEGMQTFDEHLFELYKEDVISYDEAIMNANSANNLRLQIKLYEEGLQADARNKRIQNMDLM